MKNNEKWTRDELILALDVYLQSRINNQPLGKGTKTVHELSALLRALPIHQPAIRAGDTFRNIAGVEMTLQHFVALDSTNPNEGLPNSSRELRATWNDFGNDADQVHLIATAIKQQYHEAVHQETAILVDEHILDEDTAFPEGQILTRLHIMRERNQALVTKKKQTVLAQSHTLACEVCSFDFSVVYGDLGYGFAECHHRVPVALLQPGQHTRLSDLAIVCANCHRMLHRAKPLLTIEELKARLRHS